ARGELRGDAGEQIARGARRDARGERREGAVRLVLGQGADVVAGARVEDGGGEAARGEGVAVAGPLGVAGGRRAGGQGADEGERDFAFVEVGVERLAGDGLFAGVVERVVDELERDAEVLAVGAERVDGGGRSAGEAGAGAGGEGEERRRLVAD